MRGDPESSLEFREEGDEESDLPLPSLSSSLSLEKKFEGGRRVREEGGGE